MEKPISGQGLFFTCRNTPKNKLKFHHEGRVYKEYSSVKKTIDEYMAKASKRIRDNWIYCDFIHNNKHQIIFRHEYLEL